MNIENMLLGNFSPKAALTSSLPFSKGAASAFASCFCRALQTPCSCHASLFLFLSCHVQVTVSSEHHCFPSAWLGVLFYSTQSLKSSVLHSPFVRFPTSFHKPGLCAHRCQDQVRIQGRGINGRWLPSQNRRGIMSRGACDHRGEDRVQGKPKEISTGKTSRRAFWKRLLSSGVGKEQRIQTGERSGWGGVTQAQWETGAQVQGFPPSQLCHYTVRLSPHIDCASLQGNNSSLFINGEKA